MDRSALPGNRWRLLAWNQGEKVQFQNIGTFDELVVDGWLHIEQMDKRVWWMQVGDARIVVHIPTKGEPIVTIEREAYGPSKTEGVKS